MRQSPQVRTGANGMNSHNTGVCRCPSCNAKLDHSTAIDQVSAPTAGDLSVCFYCAEKLVFNEDLTLRLMTPADALALPKAVLLQFFDAADQVRNHIKNKVASNVYH